MIDQDPITKYKTIPDKGPLKYTRRQLGQLASGLFFTNLVPERPAFIALKQFKNQQDFLKPREPVDEGTEQSSKIVTPIGTRIIEYQPSDNSGRLFLLPSPDIARVLREEPNAKISPETDAYLDPFVNQSADLRVITSGLHTKSSTLAPFRLGANIGTPELITTLAESRGLTEEELNLIGVMVVVWKNRQVIDAAAADSNYDPLRYTFRSRNMVKPLIEVTH